MMTLDDLFKDPTETFELPVLRNWKSRLDIPGTSAAVEIFQPASDLGGNQPEINVHFVEGGRPLSLETRLWDDELNAGLIRLKVRAISPANEAIRFSLGLRDALRKPARRFGDGYFNVVLVDLIQDSDLTRHPEISEVLRYAVVGKPYKSRVDDPYATCREMIAEAIGGRARELRNVLGYSLEESKQIMTTALAHLLDMRFSVSNRRRLGLL